MTLSDPREIAAEKRAQAAVARSVLLRIVGGPGLPRLDEGRAPHEGDPDAPRESRERLARRALAAASALLDLLNADLARRA